MANRTRPPRWRGAITTALLAMLAVMIVLDVFVYRRAAAFVAKLTHRSL
jgi:hypothetical protein